MSILLTAVGVMALTGGLLVWASMLIEERPQRNKDGTWIYYRVADQWEALVALKAGYAVQGKQDDLLYACQELGLVSISHCSLEPDDCWKCEPIKVTYHTTQQLAQIAREDWEEREREAIRMEEWELQQRHEARSLYKQE